MSIFFHFSLFYSLLSVSAGPDCHPLTQPDRPSSLLLSRCFFLWSFFRSYTTLVLLLSVHTHTLCFVSALYLCSLLTHYSSSLFISPLTFYSCTDVGCLDSFSQQPWLHSQIVCLPKDCLWGLRTSSICFFHVKHRHLFLIEVLLMCCMG